ncbi:MAG: hypothetical protein IT368_05525 [Candidatus Hydrogenedentes bacterium]|nr:hypothetical protein [Candidatus Hydrogenedentota bacterium]
MQTITDKGRTTPRPATAAELRAGIRFNLPQVLPTFAELRQIWNPYWILIDQVTILDYCLQRIEWTRDYIAACEDGRLNPRYCEITPGRLRRPDWRHASGLLSQWNDKSLNARLNACFPRLAVPREVRDAIALRNRLFHEVFDRQSQQHLTLPIQAMEAFLLEVLKTPELAGERDQLTGGRRRFGPTRPEPFLGIFEALGSGMAAITAPLRQLARRLRSALPASRPKRPPLPARLEAMVDKYLLIAGFAELEALLRAQDASGRPRTLVDLVRDSALLSLEPHQRKKLVRAVRLRNDLVHPEPDEIYPGHFVKRDVALLEQALRQARVRERERLAMQQIRP